MELNTLMIAVKILAISATTVVKFSPMKKECPEFVFIKKISGISRQKSASEFFSRGQMSGICPEFVYVNFFCKNIWFFNVKSIRFLMSGF